MPVAVQIIKLAWVGTRTANFDSTVDFFRDVLGLTPDLELPGFRVLKLPDGSKVEVFGPETEMNRHFTTGPVVGFLVDTSMLPPASLWLAASRSSTRRTTRAATDGSTSGRPMATSTSSPKIRAFPGPGKKA